MTAKGNFAKVLHFGTMYFNSL